MEPFRITRMTLGGWAAAQDARIPASRASFVITASLDESDPFFVHGEAFRDRALLLNRDSDCVADRSADRYDNGHCGTGRYRSRDLDVDLHGALDQAGSDAGVVYLRR